MSKAVMISIRPKWCEKIARGEKTIEVRKTRPKLETPFKCYVYCTRDKHLAFMQNQTGTNLIACMDVDAAIPVGGAIGNGKVIGEFTCDLIYELETRSPGGSYYVKGEDQPTTNDVARQSCLTLKDMHEYLKAAKGYGWHISNLKIYDEPKELSEFKGLCKVESDCCACPYYNYSKMDCDGRTIKRPFQSWGYVEEVRCLN